MAQPINVVPGIPMGSGDSGSLQDSSQNPLFVPSFYVPVAQNGQLVYKSPDIALGQSGLSRAAATATATIGGTITNGDTLTITFANGVFARFSGTQTVTITAVTADTVDSLAQKFAAAIEANSLLRAFGIVATSALAVVTISHPGPVGNFTALAESTSGGATETITLSASTLAGGSGAVVPFSNFPFVYQSQTVWMRYGLPAQIGAGLLSAMVSAGAPIG